jgi:hypothetical protein
MYQLGLLVLHGSVIETCFPGIDQIRPFHFKIRGLLSLLGRDRDETSSILFIHLGLKGMCASIAIFFFLGIARLSILWMPFFQLAPLLGKQGRNLEFSTLVNSRQLNRARRLGRLIRAIAEHTPWKSKCLVQAIAAVVFLRCLRIPYVLHLGVAKDEKNDLRAHTWVRVGPCAVTGGDGRPEFVVVSTFFYPEMFPVPTENNT